MWLEGVVVVAIAMVFLSICFCIGKFIEQDKIVEEHRKRHAAQLKIKSKIKREEV